MLNDILTLDQQWLLNRSDFPPILWHWYRAWPSPNYEWFPWSIWNGCGMPAGNAYPSGHLVPSPFFWTCLCSNCWDQIPRTCHVFIRLFTLNTPWYFLDFASYIHDESGSLLWIEAVVKLLVSPLGRDRLISGNWYQYCWTIWTFRKGVYHSAFVQGAFHAKCSILQVALDV